MAKTAAELPPTLTTKTEAINWVQSMIRDAEEKRFLCADEHYQGKGGVRKQRKAYRQFLVFYGNVLGAAGALLRVGWLTEGQYHEINAGMTNLMLPTTTEVHVEVPRG